MHQHHGYHLTDLRKVVIPQQLLVALENVLGCQEITSVQDLLRHNYRTLYDKLKPKIIPESLEYS